MIKLRQTLFLTIKSNDFIPYQQDSVKGTKDENLSVASDCMTSFQGLVFFTKVDMKVVIRDIKRYRYHLSKIIK